MTDQQWKELAKLCLDNGRRILTKEEKEAIKAAIDRADSLEEMAQVAFFSLIIDSSR